MRRLIGLFLAVCMLSIGTGAAAYLHDLDHAREDAAAEKAERRSDGPAKPHPIHDETNCRVHAVLRAPAIGGGWTPLLIAMGLIVAFLTLIASPLRSRHPAFSIDCRGPPVCA